MRVYAYLRVSDEKSTVANQRFEILKFIDARKIIINEWVEETQSGIVRAIQRDLGKIISEMKNGDLLIVSDITRVGRSLMDVMSTLNVLMEKGCHLYSIKEKFELGDNINSKVMAFAFSLSAEIERSMISARTREALQRKKASGAILGRPPGFKLKNIKLAGKESEIRNLVEHKVSLRAIARLYGVHPETVKRLLN